MEMSKHQLAGSLSKENKLLHSNKERKQSFRQLVEQLNFGKAAASKSSKMKIPPAGSTNFQEKLKEKKKGTISWH